MTIKIAILGSGSVGLTLSFFLESKGYSVFHVGRVTESREVKLLGIPGIQDTKTIKVWSESHYWSQEGLSQSFDITLVCLHTLESQKCLDRFDPSPVPPWEASRLRNPTSAWIFLCNGLLQPPSHTEGLWRGLVYLGSQMETTVKPNGLRSDTIWYRGGQKIFLGPWAASPSQLTHSLAVVSLLEQIFSETPVEWIPVLGPEPNIQQKEVQKFFCNVVLALELGPTDRPNGKLFEVMSQAQLKEWLGLFQDGFQLKTTELSTMEVSLRELVNTTASNLNSLSQQWKKGKTETLESYVQALMDRCVLDSHKKFLEIWQKKLKTSATIG
jgi:ketopantoate reductase